MKKIWIIPIALFLLSGCQWFERHRRGEIAAQVGEKILYENEVKALVPIGTSSEDSIRIVNRYIQQWATQQLLYQRAVEYSEQKEEFEAMVNDYRRQLYVHEYEQNLLQRQQSDTISEDSLKSYYDAHHELFRLRDNYIKGMFIIVPKRSRDLDKLINMLREPNDDKLPDIEAYAIEKSLGYSIFFDRWQSFSEIKHRLPLKTSDDSSWLKQNTFITLEDTTQTYLLRITDRIYSGDEMPFEIAKTVVKDVMENGQRISILKSLEQDMYKNGVKHGDIYLKETRTIEEQIAALPKPIEPTKPVTSEVNPIQQGTIMTNTQQPTITKPNPSATTQQPEAQQPEAQQSETQQEETQQEEQKATEEPEEQQTKQETKAQEEEEDETPQTQATFDFNIFD